MKALIEKSDTKHDRNNNINIKEGGNDGNGQVDKPDVETVDITGDDVPQGFVYYSDEEGVTSKLFDIS